MYEEEDEKNSIGAWERNPGDDVNGLRHTDWMRRLFFTDLNSKEKSMYKLNIQYTI